MQISKVSLSRALSAVILGAVMVMFAHAADKDAKDKEAKETTAKKEKVAPALDFKMKSLDGEEVDLSQYQGKVVMIVNVASQCGLTPQYEQLEALHEKYADKGLAVLAFPCNQFGSQEPGTSEEIKEFCSTHYGVKFDMFSKVDVNGPDAAPLYKYLKAQDTKPKGSGEISWNFEKFLLDRDGKILARFEPKVKPDAPEVVKAIEAGLEKK